MPPKKVTLKGKTNKLKVGSRKDVWHGKADRTSGGLTKRDLCLNSVGKVVSRKRSEYARRMFDESPEIRQKFKDGAAPLINAKRSNPASKLADTAIGDESDSDNDITAKKKMKAAARRRNPVVPQRGRSQKLDLEDDSSETDGETSTGQDDDDTRMPSKQKVQAGQKRSLMRGASSTRGSRKGTPSRGGGKAPTAQKRKTAK